MPAAIPAETSTDRTRQTGLLPLLAVMFLGAGLSAPIYQVLWLRLLDLVFGVTTYSASTVWPSFMTGLAIGSFGAGRVADRIRRLLVWFGACELLVGRGHAAGIRAAAARTCMLKPGVFSSLLAVD